MIYKLICAGIDSFIENYKQDKEEFIIAIDGGYQVLQQYNIKIDAFFGDFDSLKKQELSLKNEHIYSSIKDDSDFDLAIDYLINDIRISKDDKIIIYNATGGRLDHYRAIINTIIRNKDYNITLVDDRNMILISDLISMFKQDNYKYISFFSIEEDTILSLKGFKYNIDNYNLKLYDNLCLSNEIINEGILKTNKKVLVIKAN